jgi:hypothetical protein
MNRCLTIVLVLFAASPAYAAEKSLERTFKVAPGGTLTVDADAASVHVTGAETDRVSVRMTARGSEDNVENAKLEALQTDAGVTVTMRQRKNSGWLFWAWGRSDGHVEVTVPRRYGIRVETGGGSVEVADTVGAANLQTSGGNVVVKNVNGIVEARTSGGGILMDTIRGDVDANTSGGSVRLLNVDGKIKGHTSGGSVECSLVGANRGVSASTSGGSIELTLPRTTSGTFEATTSGGSISSDLPLTTMERQDGRLKGTLNGGGLPIEARTSGGSISVHAAN